jgi:hypothetical protein
MNFGDRKNSRESRGSCSTTNTNTIRKKGLSSHVTTSASS